MLENASTDLKILDMSPKLYLIVLNNLRNFIQLQNNPRKTYKEISFITNISEKTIHRILKSENTPNRTTLKKIILFLAFKKSIQLDQIKDYIKINRPIAFNKEEISMNYIQRRILIKALSNKVYPSEISFKYGRSGEKELETLKRHNLIIKKHSFYRINSNKVISQKILGEISSEIIKDSDDIRLSNLSTLSLNKEGLVQLRLIIEEFLNKVENFKASKKHLGSETIFLINTYGLFS